MNKIWVIRAHLFEILSFKFPIMIPPNNSPTPINVMTSNDFEYWDASVYNSGCVPALFYIDKVKTGIKMLW